MYTYDFEAKISIEVEATDAESARELVEDALKHVRFLNRVISTKLKHTDNPEEQYARLVAV
jgi:hypothetical protein